MYDGKRVNQEMSEIPLFYDRNQNIYSTSDCFYNKLNHESWANLMFQPQGEKAWHSNFATVRCGKSMVNLRLPEAKRCMSSKLHRFTWRWHEKKISQETLGRVTTVCLAGRIKWALHLRKVVSHVTCTWKISEYVRACALFRAGCIAMRYDFDSVDTARVDERISNGKGSEIGHQASAATKNARIQQGNQNCQPFYPHSKLFIKKPFH